MDQPLFAMPLTATPSLAESNTKVPYLIVVCGATATGKSGLAIALSQRLCETKRFDSAILSADSRQVYREFNIGTAKPSIAEQQQVPHYLIDICDPTETLTVAEYQQQAKGVIGGEGRGERGEGKEGRRQKQGGRNRGAEAAEEREDAETRGHGDTGTRGQKQLKTQNASLITSPLTPHPSPLFLVGGTGLYIRSIVRGLKIPRVAPQMELRSQLQMLGQPQLYAFLRQVDPDAAGKIHPHDKVRTLRSLEVFYVTGQPMSAQQGENPPTYPILQIGLECQSVAQSDRRIAQRTEQMVEAGFVGEVQYLCQKYGEALPLLNTLGYAEFKQHLAGDISLAEAKALTILHTRQFAKRQRTWFRADPAIEWFDADSPDLLEQVWQRVQKFLADRR